VAGAHRLGRSYRLLGLARSSPSGSGISHRLVEQRKRSAVMALMSMFVAWSLLALVGYLAEERRINGQVPEGAVAGYICFAGGSPPACC